MPSGAVRSVLGGVGGAACLSCGRRDRCWLRIDRDVRGGMVVAATLGASSGVHECQRAVGSALVLPRA